MKKLASILLTVSSLAVTATADVYLGLKVGPTFNTGEFSSNDTEATDNVHSAKGGPGASMFGGVFLGYDMVTSSNVYFALEANLEFHNLKNEVRRSTVANTASTSRYAAAPLVKLENSLLWGADAQLGYKLPNDVIPFISVGVLGGKYKLTAQNDSSAAQRALGANSTQQFEKDIVGLNLGLGLKYIYEQLMITTQYQYLLGQKMSKDFSDNAADPKIWNYSQQIHQHQVSVGIAYVM